MGRKHDLTGFMLKTLSSSLPTPQTGTGWSCNYYILAWGILSHECEYTERTLIDEEWIQSDYKRFQCHVRSFRPVNIYSKSHGRAYLCNNEAMTFEQGAGKLL